MKTNCEVHEAISYFLSEKCELEIRSGQLSVFFWSQKKLNSRLSLNLIRPINLLDWMLD